MTEGFTDKNKKFRPTGSNKKKLSKEQVLTPQRSTSSMITERGLIPNFTNTIPLNVGAEYYLGGSSSPDHVIITGLNKEVITYRRYPYGKENESKIERDVGETLIREGLATMEKLWKTSGLPVLQERANTHQRILDGDPTAPNQVNFADLQPVTVKAFLKKPLPIPETEAEHDRDQKMWYHAESFGGVGGLGDGKADEKGRTKTIGYEIVTTRGQLDKVIKDSLFKEVKIIEDRFKGR